MHQQIKAIDFHTNAMEMISISELEDEKTSELLFARIRYCGNNFILNKKYSDFPATAFLTFGQVPPFIFYLYVDDVKASDKTKTQKFW